MLVAALSLVVYVAAAFVMGEADARWGVFTDKAACETAIAKVRAEGYFATDCVKVTMPTPKNGAPTS